MGAGPGGHNVPYISGFEETRRFLVVPKRVPILVSKLGPSEAPNGTSLALEIGPTCVSDVEPQPTSFWDPIPRGLEVRFYCYLQYFGKVSHLPKGSVLGCLLITIFDRNWMNAMV